MKNTLPLFLTLSFFCANAQSPISSVTTSSVPAASNYSYMVGDTTYNWGVSPNNSRITITGFTSGSESYTYATSLPGSIKLRRVDNANVTGNYSVQWVEAETDSTVFNFFPEYHNRMDSFLNSKTYNKGTDNLFDNTALNSNNIERLDWILGAGYSTATPDKVGIAVFDKGFTGSHDRFAIAAITSLDSAGDPLTYGNIIRVIATDYGKTSSSLTYRIVKGPDSANLLNAGTATQDIGGVFISFVDLGIAASATIYGYSLFANDLPDNTTPLNLVDYTNTTYFPLNSSGSEGGLDLVALTGFSVANTVLPLGFISFNAVEFNDKINLKWESENETLAERYDIERSEDGVYFTKVSQVTAGNSNHAYSYVDNVSLLGASQLYYRIKRYSPDGSFYFSKAILIRRNLKALSIVMYPNPVKETLFLNIASIANEKATIVISNSAGLPVIRQQQQLSRGNNYITINGINKLPKGVYQVSVTWKTPVVSITKQISIQ